MTNFVSKKHWITLSQDDDVAEHLLEEERKNVSGSCVSFYCPETNLNDFRFSGFYKEGFDSSDVMAKELDNLVFDVELGKRSREAYQKLLKIDRDWLKVSKDDLYEPDSVEDIKDRIIEDELGFHELLEKERISEETIEGIFSEYFHYVPVKYSAHGFVGDSSYESSERGVVGIVFVESQDFAKQFGYEGNNDSAAVFSEAEKLMKEQIAYRNTLARSEVYRPTVATEFASEEGDIKTAIWLFEPASSLIFGRMNASRENVGALIKEIESEVIRPAMNEADALPMLGQEVEDDGFPSKVGIRMGMTGEVLREAEEVTLSSEDIAAVFPELEEGELYSPR